MLANVRAGCIVLQPLLFPVVVVAGMVLEPVAARGDK